MSIKKVVVIGPESTGKSTLSKALAAALHTVWVPEYARGYLEALTRPYEQPDLLRIAKGQLISEQEYALKGNNTLICDTDLQVVRVWSEHRYNRCDRWILEQIAACRYDLYLLTYIDIPWQADPLREHSDTAMRRYFYNQYHDIVVNSGVKWVDIRGDMATRLQTSLNAIRQIQ